MTEQDAAAIAWLRSGDVPKVAGDRIAGLLESLTAEVDVRDKHVDSLTAELETAKREAFDAMGVNDSWAVEVDRLTAENQRLREALEQYADDGNWMCTSGHDCGTEGTCCLDSWQHRSEVQGPTLARVALSQPQEPKGGDV